MITKLIEVKIKLQKNLFTIYCFAAISVVANQYTVAQNNGPKLSDSLKTNSYNELYELVTLNLNNPILAEKYAILYLNKGKKEKDTLKIAQGYNQLSSIQGFNNINIAIQYTDSIIELTKNFKNDTYPGFAYLLKGMCYNNKGEYKKALHFYLIAQEHSVLNKNAKQLYYVKNQIGQLKYIWGSYQEALAIFKNQLIFLEKNKTNFKEFNELQLTTLFHLSNCYLLTKNLDSSLMYSKKGLIISLNKESKTTYNLFLSQIGEIYFHQNKFSQAIDSILKANRHETSLNGIFNNHVVLAKIFNKQQKHEKAFFHYTKADSLYNVTKDVVPEVRDIQEFFISYYKSTNDIENQLKYIDRLLAVDSIMKGFNKNLIETIHKEYDTPILLSEKQQIISNLKNKERKSALIILTLLIILLIAVIFSFRYYQKEKEFKKRFKKLILNQKSEQKEETISKEETVLEQNGISKETIAQILTQLKNFEKNNSFIDNSITLNSLALTFETNSSYLSKVINAHKNKNFSTYLTDLRIDYAIKKLQNDLTFRKFGIKAIAFEVGFNNAESFSKAFFKKTAIYPSFFIKELDNEA